MVRTWKTVYDPVMPLNAAMVKKIGDRIGQARNAKKLSQEEVAERANLSPGYVGKVERGVKTPSLATIITLAEALDTSPLDLLIDLDHKLTNEQVKARIKTLLESL